jgi:hypothetical protein
MQPPTQLRGRIFRPKCGSGHSLNLPGDDGTSWFMFGVGSCGVAWMRVEKGKTLIPNVVGAQHGTV